MRRICLTGEGRLTSGAHLVGTLVGIWLEHHRPSKGTTGLSGATSQSPRACQGHHSIVRDNTCLAGAPQVCQGTAPVRNAKGHNTLIRRNTCQVGAPQICQGHHRLVGGTTVPSRGTRTPQTCHEHQSETPRACEEPLRLVGGTTGLPGAVADQGEGPTGPKSENAGPKCVLALPFQN